MEKANPQAPNTNPLKMIACQLIKKLLSAILILLVFSCGDTDHTTSTRSGSFAEKTATVIDSRPCQSEPNPIDCALEEIGLSKKSLARPPFFEEGYLLACRNPLIDHAAESPFGLQAWANDAASQLQKVSEDGLAPLLSEALKTLKGGVNRDIRADGKDFSKISFKDAYSRLFTLYGLKVSQQNLDAFDRFFSPPHFDQLLGRLVTFLADAGQLCREALSKLSPSEIEYLQNRPERYFYPRDNQFVFLTAPTYEQSKIIHIVRKIDFNKLFAASIIAAEAVDAFSSFARKHPVSAFFQNGRSKSDIKEIVLPSPVGDIVILGENDSTYSKACALLIDLGGNDHYSGTVGVGHLTPGRITIVIDVKGDDVYDQRDQPFSQGFGCLSVAVVADLAGNDHYMAGDMSQGSGIYGVGMLMDRNGRDKYDGGLLSQGFGLLGIGLLLEERGADIYTVTGMSQGAGSTMGMGVLCDREGNDKYLADTQHKRGKLLPDQWSHVQGAGFSIRSPDWTKNISYYGGIGLLTDGSGDDLYWASDENAMGASYFLSIGALVDHGGNDKYMPQKGNALGYAVHLSNGVLVDLKGDDYYLGNHSGGLASDQSVAILADQRGNDIYGPSDAYTRKTDTAKDKPESASLSSAKKGEENHREMAELSWGASLKGKSIGVLMDCSGNDQYFWRSEGMGGSCGDVLPPNRPDRWSHALFFDFNGDDFYSHLPKMNNRTIVSHGHGVFCDIRHPENRTANEDSFLFNLPSIGRNAPENRSHPHFEKELQGLSDSDIFIRFSAIGRLQEKEGFLGPLLDVLRESEEKPLNDALLEAVDIAIATKRMDQHEKYVRLLESKSVTVRKVAARTLGWRKIKEVLPQLLEASGRPENEEIYPDILWSIGRIGTQKASRILIDALKNGKTNLCRQKATEALASMPLDGMADKSTIAGVMLASLSDPDETIRTFSAAGLLRVDDSPKSIRKLSTAMEKDASPYVRRAAAKSLILAGHKNAIPHFIETLSFRSIDTYPFYDNDLPKELSLFCGVDFPESERYLAATWSKWWAENASHVDLQRNLEIRNEILRVFSEANEQDGIALFEMLLQQKPKSLFVRKRYKQFCREWIFYRLMTKKRIDQEVVKRCIRLQKIIIAIGPETSDQWEQLASFHMRLSDFASAAHALQKALHLSPERRHLNTEIQKLQAKIGQTRHSP